MNSAVFIAIRGSIIGGFINFITKGKVLSYKEDLKDYVIDQKYLPITESFEINNDKEEYHCMKKAPSAVLVTFDSNEDPEHPHNWPFLLKVYITIMLSTYSGFIYIASSTYVPAKKHLMQQFNINDTVAVLPLTLFVIAYGVSPMIFSPLSEHPRIGRNVIYCVTMLIFCLLQIPCAMTNSFSGLCIVRFLSGVFASPILSTGGASFADMFSLPFLPMGMANWALGSYMGMALGPIIGGVLEMKTGGWRWSFWILFIVAGGYTIIFWISIPETYPKNILYLKSQRLSRITGTKYIVDEFDHHIFTKRSMKEIVWRPIEIAIYEPVVILINVYIGLVYSIIYIWFEAFPLLYSEAYGFSNVIVGCFYLPIVIGVSLGIMLYDFMIYNSYSKKILKKEVVYPEVFIPTAIIGSVLLPIGIFIFGWTGSPQIHWIGSCFGSCIYGMSAVILFQTLLNYLGMSFYRYVASAFASNTCVRSMIAGCFPLFGRVLFKNLGSEKFPVGVGSTVLGAITIVMVAVPVLFYLNGPKLRARSRYSGMGESE